MDRGASNVVNVKATNGLTSVRITRPCAASPAWLGFARDLVNLADVDGTGNGNAFLFGTPPDGTTVEEFEIYLHAKPAMHQPSRRSRQRVRQRRRFPSTRCG